MLNEVEDSNVGECTWDGCWMDGDVIRMMAVERRKKNVLP